MSGIALVLGRDGAPVEPEVTAPMLGALGVRAIDGVDELRAGPIWLAHAHHWTTPEELGERQPLVAGDGRLWIAFDGRLDDRDGLWRALPPAARDRCGSPASDATLVAAAFEAWGAAAFARLYGPFAVIVVELDARRVHLARDPLGDRALAVHLSERRLIVATDDHVVAAHPAVGRRLDRVRLATHFALEDPWDGRTFLDRVELVLPGERWAVEGGRVTRDLFWAPDPERRLDGCSDGALAERFRHLLEESVRARLRAVERPALMVSGGLDSSPIAAVATGARPDLVALTWAFPEHDRTSDPSLFERSYIDDLLAIAPAELIEVPCSDAWPLREPWPMHPACPAQNAYRWFQDRSFAAAAAAGSRVVLNGMFGDQLYLGGGDWWLDALCAGEGARAHADLLWYLRARFVERRRGLRGPITRPAWMQPAATWPWLTAAARALLPDERSWPPGLRHARRPVQYTRVLDLASGHGIVIERWFAARHGVDLRFPMRDLRLVELMLAVPTSALLRRGVRRPIVRRAFADVLPSSIRERRTKATFEPVLRRGLFAEEAARVDRLLDRPARRWPELVDGAWLDDVRRTRPRHGRELLVLWLCAALERWLVEPGHGAGWPGMRAANGRPAPTWHPRAPTT